MRRKKRQQLPAGPGRPRKYGEDLKKFQTAVPESTYDDLYELKEELNVPFSELLTWLVKLAKGQIDKLKLLAKTRHQEEYIKQLEKEKQALLEEIEKKNAIIEKLQLQIQALKLGSKTVVRDAIKLKAIAEKIEEGKSWKEVCALAGFRDEDKIREILKIAFNVKRDKHGEWPRVIRPKDIVKEFHGWALVKPFESVELIDYVLVKEENLEKFLKLKKGVKLRVNVTDPEAEITSRLNNWYYIYMDFMKEGSEKEAAEYLLKVQHEGLKQLLEEYGDKIVLSVVYSDPRFSTVFAPLLESLIRELKKKEVVVDE